MLRQTLSPDGPQEQPLSTPRVDMEFVDLGEVHDHCDIDEEEVTLEGGCFSKEECAGVTIRDTYWSLPDLFPMTLDQTRRSRKHSEGSKQSPNKATRVGM